MRPDGLQWDLFRHTLSNRSLLHSVEPLRLSSQTYTRWYMYTSTGKYIHEYIMTYTLLHKFIDVYKSSSGEYWGVFLPPLLIMMYWYRDSPSSTHPLPSMTRRILTKMIIYPRCLVTLLMLLDSSSATPHHDMLLPWLTRARTQHICRYLRCVRTLLNIFVAIYGVRAHC